MLSSGTGTGTTDDGTGGPANPTLLYYGGSYRLDGPHSDGPTYDLAPGTQRTVSGTLYWDSWEVWADPYGYTSIQSHSSAVVTAATLNLSLAQGDGVLTETQITTDATGGFFTPFAMGMAASRVRVESTDASSGTIAGEIDFTPPASGPGDPFVFSRQESSLFVSVTSSPPATGTETIPLQAQITETTWEVWESGTAPAELRNYRTGPAIAASLSFSVSSGSGTVNQIDYVTDADGSARAEIIPGQPDTVVAVQASFLATTASGEITVSPVPWTHQSSDARLVLTLEPMAGTLQATVRLQSWEIWVNPATGLGEIRHESEGPAANAEVRFQTVPGAESATFSPGTVMTATNGIGSTVYTSANGTSAEVTATFAGITVIETIPLPAALDTTGGTGNGSGPGGTNNGGPNPGTSTGGSTGGLPGNNQNNQQTSPDLPLPKTTLQGRNHETQGGSGTFAGYHGGIEDQVLIETRYRSLYLSLVRDVYDVDNLKMGEETMDLIAPVDDFPAELAQKFNENWRKANPEEAPRGLASYEHIEVIPGSPAIWEDATGSPFWVKGPVPPDFHRGAVDELAAEGIIRDFYEGSEQFNDPSAYWTGNVSPMGFPGGWTEANRRAYGQSPHIGAPELVNSAKFLTGILPGVQWSEYWVQANGLVPAGKEAKHSLTFLATERNAAGELGFAEAGTITFTIPGGSDLSDGVPVIEGFGQARSWFEATADGTLLVKPPVERGVERSLLPVEIVVPELSKDREIQRTGDGKIQWKVASELKVAQWDPYDVWDMGNADMQHFAFPDFNKDRDQFVVRIKGLSEEDFVSVMIETKGRSEDSRYKDNPTEVELEWDQELKGFKSKSMCLVSDEIDDRFDGEQYGSDDQLNDRTHIVELGGELKITSIIINGHEQAHDLALPVPVKKVLEVSCVILEGTSMSEGDVDDFTRIAKERYAQIGVDVVLKSTVTEPVPAGVDLSDGIDDTPMGALAPSVEKRTLLEALSTSDSGDLQIFFVGPCKDGLAAGWAEWTGGFNNSDYIYANGGYSQYLNNVFIFDPHNPTGMVLSHELAHILLQAAWHPNLGMATGILAEHDPGPQNYDLRNLDKGKRIGKESDLGEHFGTRIPDLGEIMLQNSLLKNP